MTDTYGRAPTKSGWRLALLGFSQLIIAVDYNIVYVALPDIGESLNFSAQSLQWVVSAYAVGYGGLLLFGGRLVDRLGARRVWFASLVIYGLSSLVGGFATDPGVLIAARAVQGAGGALLFPSTLTLIFIGFAEGPERNRALSVWGAIGGAGLAAGALLGGLFTDWWGWSSVMFVNVPLTVLALLAGIRLLPADGPAHKAIREFDVPGALLATAGASLVVFGLASGPSSGWTSLQSLGAEVLGGLLLISFVVVEAKTRSPLMPLRLVRTRTLAVTMAVGFLFMVGLATGYYVLTTYLQPVLGYNPTEAGLAFLPLCACSMAAGKLTAPLLNRFGLRTVFTGTLIVNGAGIVLTALAMSAGGSYWALLPGIVLWGFGGGVGFTVVFAAAGMGISPLEQGVASSAASTSMQIGGAVGLAALVAVANHGIDYGGVPAPTGAEIVDGLQLAGVISGIVVAAACLITFFFLKNPAPVPAAEPAGAQVDEVEEASATA
ncbi:MFS transporter [Frankia sp. CNm7]|uniref:MFS transporter n=1 Tax=Frankia nepalensis TaxID=1836974 RepID=A0A937RBT2_9ACTN|nr:MFS transporter [Frankia nepalensis]MBL7502383.1 MFS transporter [Frankia nepalensis]MBL7516222.1 MFS transporter [Frankia nepalensis]MBL7519427.1 MFS transporter [Frankia nepalensis]MBL7629211.1 MFS transporter [Frankia nepalensis]